MTCKEKPSSQLYYIDHIGMKSLALEAWILMLNIFFYISKFSNGLLDV